jgi:hypothetical protein
MKNIKIYIYMLLIYLNLALILGIPRLYIIWFINSIHEIYNILCFKYYTLDNRNKFENPKSLKEKIIFLSFFGIYFLFTSYFNSKYEFLNQIIKLIYDNLFIFDLIKFLNNKYGGPYGLWLEFDDRELLKKKNFNYVYFRYKKSFWKILYDYVELIYLCNEHEGIYYCNIDNNNIYEKKKLYYLKY